MLDFAFWGVCAGNVSDFAAHEQQHLFHILTTGVYPTVAVTDARCAGSMVSISKKHLWNLFSLDRWVQQLHVMRENVVVGWFICLN